MGDRLGTLCAVGIYQLFDIFLFFPSKISLLVADDETFLLPNNSNRPCRTEFLFFALKLMPRAPLITCTQRKKSKMRNWLRTWKNVFCRNICSAHIFHSKMFTSTGDFLGDKHMFEVLRCDDEKFMSSYRDQTFCWVFSCTEQCSDAIKTRFSRKIRNNVFIGNWKIFNVWRHNFKQPEASVPRPLKIWFVV